MGFNVHDFRPHNYEEQPDQPKAKLAARLAHVLEHMQTMEHMIGDQGAIARALSERAHNESSEKVTASVSSSDLLKLKSDDTTLTNDINFLIGKGVISKPDSGVKSLIKRARKSIFGAGSELNRANEERVEGKLKLLGEKSSELEKLARSSAKPDLSRLQALLGDAKRLVEDISQDAKDSHLDKMLEAAQILRAERLLQSMQGMIQGEKEYLDKVDRLVKKLSPIEAVIKRLPPSQSASFSEKASLMRQELSIKRVFLPEFEKKLKELESEAHAVYDRAASVLAPALAEDAYDTKKRLSLRLVILEDRVDTALIKSSGAGLEFSSLCQELLSTVKVLPDANARSFHDRVIELEAALIHQEISLPDVEADVKKLFKKAVSEYKSEAASLNEFLQDARKSLLNVSGLPEEKKKIQESIAEIEEGLRLRQITAKDMPSYERFITGLIQSMVSAKTEPLIEGYKKAISECNRELGVQNLSTIEGSYTHAYITALRGELTAEETKLSQNLASLKITDESLALCKSRLEELTNRIKLDDVVKKDLQKAQEEHAALLNDIEKHMEQIKPSLALSGGKDNNAFIREKFEQARADLEALKAIQNPKTKEEVLAKFASLKKSVESIGTRVQFLKNLHEQLEFITRSLGPEGLHSVEARWIVETERAATKPLTTQEIAELKKTVGLEHLPQLVEEATKLRLEEKGYIRTPPLTPFQQLCKALDEGDEQALYLLKNYGVNFNAVNADKETALHYAVKEDKLAMLALLTKLGVSIDRVDKNEFTPIALAAKLGNKQMVKKLQDLGADVQGTKDLVNSPLVKAIRIGNVEMIKFLKNECGVDVNVVINKSETPILIAMALQPDLVPLLVELGGDYEFSREFIERQYAAAVWGIGGHTVLVDAARGRKEGIKLEVLYPTYVGRQLSKYAESFFTEDTFGSGARLEGILEPDELANIKAAVKAAGSLKTNKQIESIIQSGKPYIIMENMPEHSISFVFHNGKLMVCNRGLGKTDDGVEIFSIDKCPMGLKELIERCKTPFPTTLAFKTFLNSLMPARVGSLWQKDQRVGNCSKANSNSAVHAMIYSLLEKRVGQEKARKLGAKAYKCFTAHMRASIEEYIDDSTKPDLRILNEVALKMRKKIMIPGDVKERIVAKIRCIHDAALFASEFIGGKEDEWSTYRDSKTGHRMFVLKNPTPQEIAKAESCPHKSKVSLQVVEEAGAKKILFDATSLESDEMRRELEPIAERRKELFFTKGEGHHLTLTERLTDAAMRNDFTQVELIMGKYGPSLLGKLDRNGIFLLVDLAENNRLGMARLLKERGLDVNMRAFKNQETFLHQAVNRSNVNVTRFLLEVGADMTIKDAVGNTPLDYLKDVDTSTTLGKSADDLKKIAIKKMLQEGIA